MFKTARKMDTGSFRARLTGSVQVPMIAPMTDGDTTQNETMRELETWVRIGDYRSARPAAQKAAHDPSLSEAERKRAADLVEAMAVDKGAVVAFIVTGLLILFLVFQYWL